jgi:hypothetical protein
LSGQKDLALSFRFWQHSTGLQYSGFSSPQNAYESSIGHASPLPRQGFEHQNTAVNLRDPGRADADRVPWLQRRWTPSVPYSDADTHADAWTDA